MSYKPWFVALHGAFIELARLLYFCSGGIITPKIAWVTVPLKALVQAPWGLAVSSQCALQSWQSTRIFAPVPANYTRWSPQLWRRSGLL